MIKGKKLYNKCIAYLRLLKLESDGHKVYKVSKIKMV